MTVHRASAGNRRPRLRCVGCHRLVSVWVDKVGDGHVRTHQRTPNGRTCAGSQVTIPARFLASHIVDAGHPAGPARITCNADRGECRAEVEAGTLADARATAGALGWVTDIPVRAWYIDYCPSHAYRAVAP